MASKLTEIEREDLKKCYLLKEMFENRGYTNVYKRLLEERRDQSFPDPSAFKNEKEFLHAATTASLFKKVIAELLDLEKMNIDRIDHLEKKDKGIEQPDPFKLK